jgi:hypothetical protein
LSFGACLEQELIMPNWIDEQVQKQRFEDMVRTADRDRLAGRVQLASVKRMRFYSPILAQLGRRLELYGYRLQLRYGVAAEVAIATDSQSTTSGC